MYTLLFIYFYYFIRLSIIQHPVRAIILHGWPAYVFILLSPDWLADWLCEV